VRTGTLLGYPYQVHPVWLLIFATLLVSLVSTVDGSGVSELSGPAALIVGALVVALFVVSIVAHELSHALMSKRLGLPRQRIQMLTLGRPYEREPDPTSPQDELKVASVGPLLSAVIGGLLLAAASLVPASADDMLRGLYWTCWWLGLANLVLAGFHLVPVLPFDGGRIVRALIWASTRELDRASSMTAFAGRMFGYMVIGSGLFIAISVDLFVGVWMVLLGWFTTRLTRGAVDRLRMERLTTDLTVGDATDTEPTVILPSLAIETLLIADEQRADQGVYPVVEDGRLLGVVFTARVRGRWRRRRTGEEARDALIPIERAPSFRPDDPLVRAVEKLEAMRINGLPVVTAEDPVQLYGVVTRARVVERLRVRQAMARARDGSAPSDVRG
jgi:Zn-dependent protease